MNLIGCLSEAPRPSHHTVGAVSDNFLPFSFEEVEIAPDFENYDRCLLRVQEHRDLLYVVR